MIILYYKVALQCKLPIPDSIQTHSHHVPQTDDACGIHCRSSPSTGRERERERENECNKSSDVLTGLVFTWMLALDWRMLWLSWHGQEIDVLCMQLTLEQFTEKRSRSLEEVPSVRVSKSYSSVRRQGEGRAQDQLTFPSLTVRDPSELNSGTVIQVWLTTPSLGW